MKHVVLPGVTITVAGPAITTLLTTSKEPGVAFWSTMVAVRTVAEKGVVTETVPRVVAVGGVAGSCVKFRTIKKRSGGTVIVVGVSGGWITTLTKSPAAANLVKTKKKRTGRTRARAVFILSAF